MAEIVIGLGASHTPQVNTGPEIWHKHGERDKNNSFFLADGTPATYDDLLPLAPDLSAQLTEEVFREKSERSEAAIASLGKALAEADVDVAVVIGDDQRELFQDELIPCFGIFTGPSVYDHPIASEKMEKLPTGLAEAQWAFHGDEDEAYPIHHELATHIAHHLMGENFDIANATGQYPGRALGHAFTYPKRRFFPDTAIPMIPIFVNTYYPPNRPTATRCFDFGAALGRAIRAWSGAERVAVIATGGLTHFLVDEAFDQQVLAFLQNPVRESLNEIPDARFISGTAEALNWIVLAGAVGDDVKMETPEYIPGYRSPAGTGVGLAFAKWS